MGVLKFFRYLSLKYPQCLHKLLGTIQACESASSKGIYTEWLELDLNSIFHTVAQEVYQYGNKASFSVSLMHPKKISPPKNIPEETLFLEICSRIEQIRKIIKPTKGIYFATDGVAGFSKIAQQRKRRFKSCLDSDDKDDKDDKNKDNTSNTGKFDSNTSNTSGKFDSNCISTGTLFMERLSKYIDSFIQQQIESNPEWKGLEIIISNYSVAGEGEQKCIEHMRKNSQLSYTVCSPDADLIFLELGLHNLNLYVFRENIFDDIDASFFLVDIGILRQCILKEIKMQDEKDEEKIKVIIEDFIVYCFFIGNDFLPQIPSLNITNDGIENIFLIYPKIIKEHGFISCKSGNNYSLRKEGMKAFLYEMSQIEYQMIINNQKRNQSRYPDTILKKYISYPIIKGKFRTSGLPERMLTIDFNKYIIEYNKKKFNGVDIKIVVQEYFKGMTFVLKYYLNKIPSNRWCYPFHYAPFFKDLYAHIDDFDIDFKFEIGDILSPYEQLLAILPGKSAYLLPDKLQYLSTSADSPIIDMFPIDFAVDLEGKKQDYEGIILIPHVNIDRLTTAFKDVENNLSECDKMRNVPGNIREILIPI